MDHILEGTRRELFDFGEAKCVSQGWTVLQICLSPRMQVGLQGPLGSRDRPTGDRVLGGQGVGLQCSRGSRGRLTGSQEVKGYAQRFPGGRGVGLGDPRGSRNRPTGPQGVKGQAYSFSTKKKPLSSWDISNDFHFHSTSFNILLPTIGKITSSLSAFMGEEKYFFLDQKEILSCCCPLGTLQFCLIGSIGLNQVQ